MFRQGSTHGQNDARLCGGELVEQNDYATMQSGQLAFEEKGGEEEEEESWRGGREDQKCKKDDLGHGSY